VNQDEPVIPDGGNFLSRDVKGALPRLLYIGDVPVSNTFGGATFLYRLLKNYPADRLVVCAPVVEMKAPLPGVRYVRFDARWPRLLRTRFSPLYCAWISWRLNSIPRWSRKLVREFRPTAVVTISQTCGWILAWRLAQKEKLPLFMFVHDDHMFYKHLPQRMWPWAQQHFAEAYRYSAGRLCISDSMAEEYERRYGVAGEIQFPLRDSQNPILKDPAPQTSERKKALTFIYAGSIHGDPSLRQILAFATAAANNGHKLVVYSPQHAELRQRAAGTAGLEARPPVASSAKLATCLREEGDCLLVTGSFDSTQSDEVRTLFPSKVADYSAIGLPLIAWAPPYASIAEFARKHAGVMELVTDSDPSALTPAMARLAASPELRTRLAKAILQVGAEMFSPESAWGTFAERLRRRTSGRDAR